MKQNEAAAFLPLIKAWADGKTLQYDASGNGIHWRDMPPENNWTFDTQKHYRVKPEPRLRPWRSEEVPVGAQITDRYGKHPKVRWLILNVGCRDVGIANACEITNEKFESLLESFHYSTDNGKTWSPCGVEETA